MHGPSEKKINKLVDEPSSTLPRIRACSEEDWRKSRGYRERRCVINSMEESDASCMGRKEEEEEENETVA